MDTRLQENNQQKGWCDAAICEAKNLEVFIDFPLNNFTDIHLNAINARCSLI